MLCAPVLGKGCTVILCEHPFCTCLHYFTHIIKINIVLDRLNVYVIQDLICFMLEDHVVVASSEGFSESFIIAPKGRLFNRPLEH